MALRARQDFPRVTGPLYFLVTAPFFYFLPHGASSFFLRATAPAARRVFVSLSFAFHCSFVVVVVFFFFRLLFRSLLLRHRVRCCSIRETRHDSDISPEVAGSKVDH